MESRSVWDLDSGEYYLQFTHEVTMPVLQTDYIEFIIMFQSSDESVTMSDTLTTLKYDMFKCIVEEDVFAKGYWATTAEDYNVRSSDGGTTFTTELDDNA